MNVYIVEVSRRLAALGIDVEIFTRATSSDLPPIVEMAPGVTVRHVIAGPYEGLGKNDLPAQLCAFTSGVLRAEAMHEPGYYDLIHSHYWLSGQVGWLARDRWGVPLIHSAHTLAKVKNSLLAVGDVPEPRARVIGEEQVVAEADRLIASTDQEADDLVSLYAAAPDRVHTIAPGVDLVRFRPGDQALARAAVGVPADAIVLLFVGRIQPLKAPDVMLRAAARLVENEPDLARRLRVVVVGAPSGTGLEEPQSLQDLAGTLGIAEQVSFVQPVSPNRLADFYRAADVTVVPSYNESFGLVALESQACGTPVVAAAVGGLTTAVADGTSGLLVVGHDPVDYAAAVRRIVLDGGLATALSAGGVARAAGFSWDRTASELVAAYTEAMGVPSYALPSVR